MSSAPGTAPCVAILSKCTVYPDKPSTLGDLKLTVPDLLLLSCHYNQKGLLFPLPSPCNTSPSPSPSPSLDKSSIVPHLENSLSKTLSHFPPLAGRLVTDSGGHVYVTCNDAGADFLHADASSSLSISDIISPLHVPDCVNWFFPLRKAINYQGHSEPVLAVQVTELSDGVFVACTANHSVVDGTSFWNFFNAFAEVSRGVLAGNGDNMITRVPDFTRDGVVLAARAVLRLPHGGPKLAFNDSQPLFGRIFSFSREAILHLKSIANGNGAASDVAEIIGKQEDKVVAVPSLNYNNQGKEEAEISSFQSLCALLWRAITRARKLTPAKTTTFWMGVNVRHRSNPKLNPLYFGNAIQGTPTYASAGDITSRDLGWCARELNRSIQAHDDVQVCRSIREWEANPRCAQLVGILDEASISMGSSPRFPIYETDFGWGRPTAVMSGPANKFDGKMMAFPGREGAGSVDIQVDVAPETMAGIESDSELMQFVSEFMQSDSR